MKYSTHFKCSSENGGIGYSGEYSNFLWKNWKVAKIIWKKKCVALTCQALDTKGVGTFYLSFTDNKISLDEKDFLNEKLYQITSKLDYTLDKVINSFFEEDNNFQLK